MTLDEMKAARLKFLNRLYELTGGNEHKIVDMWQLGQQVGLDRETIQMVAQYLKGEYLLQFRAIGGIIGITHEGVREVEDALSHPTTPTHYFPPAVNVIHIGSMTNSTIQQATAESVQNVTFSTDQTQSLQSLVAEIRQAIATAGLSADVKAEAEADLGALAAQASSPKPKPSVVRECLASVRSIFENIVGNVAAAAIVAKIAAFH